MTRKTIRGEGGGMQCDEGGDSFGKTSTHVTVERREVSGGD